jgi:hypothetical protein
MPELLSPTRPHDDAGVALDQVRRSLAIALALSIGCGAPSRTIEQPRGDVVAERVFRCETSDRSAPDFDVEALDRCFADPDARAVGRFVHATATIEHEVDAYLARFRDDAVRIHARWEPTSPYDRTLDRARFERGVRALARPDDERADVAIDGIEVRIEGDRARARGLVHYRWASGETAVEGHEYVLQRHGTDWRIASLRTWLVTSEQHGTFTDETWSEADRIVDAARERVASATGDVLADARRAMYEALASAQRYEEALAVARLLTDSPEATSTDWWTRAEAARMMFELDEMTDALARAPAARLPALDRVMREEVHCIAAGEEAPPPSDEELEEGDEDPCTWQIVSRLDASDPAAELRGIAIVRLRRGAEPRESHVLVFGVAGSWREGPRLGDGPRGREPVNGTLVLQISEPSLRQIVPGGSEELVMRYRTETSEGDDEIAYTAESGLIVCGALAAPLRCARLPDSIRSTISGGGSRRPVTATATATITFDPDGSVRVTPRSGQNRWIVPGVRSLRQVLDEAARAPR